MEVLSQEIAVLLSPAGARPWAGPGDTGGPSDHQAGPVQRQVEPEAEEASQHTPSILYPRPGV